MRTNMRRLGLLTMSVMLTTLAVIAMGVVLWGSRVGYAAADADLVHVNGDNGADGDTCGDVVSPCRTIQYAIARRVDAGGVISVAAGTYVEQVVITKALTLQGVGSDTVIESPTTLTASFSTGDEENYPIVTVSDVDDVTIQRLVVDGAGQGQGNYRFVAIGYRNAGGTVEDVEIRDVRETPFSGNQHGVAVYVYNDDGTSRDVTVANCDIYGFQKNGLALNAGPTTTLTVDVQGNRITGRGVTTITAQNGIQVSAEQGGGTIANNTITKIAYDNTDAPVKEVASSILIFGADLHISGNTVQEGHVGIYNIDGASEISGNTFEIEKVGVFGFGIIASDPPRAVPSPFSQGAREAQQAGALEAQGAASVLEVVISRNQLALSGSDNADTVGIEAEAGYGADDLALSVQGNAITGFGVGIEMWQCESDCHSTPGTFTELEANYNRIVGNDTGLLSNVDYLSVDAMNNWWGCNEGASAVPGDCDTIAGTVDANPWLVLRLSADPELVIVGEGASELTADLRYNSGGLDTSSQGHVPDGTHVGFAATLGTATPQITGTVDGVAHSTFSAGSVAGPAVISATVDNETVTTEVIVEQVDLAISKTDGVETVRPGDLLTYTLTITNDSLLAATGIVVTDTLPVSTTYVGGSDWDPVGDLGIYTQSVGALGAGESTTLSLSVRLSETVPGGFGTITNTAEVADDGTHGPRAFAKDDDVDEVVVPPDLVVAKGNGVEVIEPGQVLTYTLTVSNAGRQDATGVVLTDTLPTHSVFVTATHPFSSSNGVVTWALSELPVDQAVTRTLVVRVADAPWPAGVEAITNTAVVVDDGTYGADLDVTDNEAADVDAVDADPDLIIFKDDGEESAILGEVTSYILTYINRGNQVAGGVVITETVPEETTFEPDASTPGWQQVGATDTYTLSVGTLAPGSGNVALFAVRVDDTLAAGVTSIENTAFIADDGTSGADRNPGNNSDDDVNAVSGAPDLAVSKDNDVASVKPSDVVTYTLTVRNLGTQGATGVVVTDSLPTPTAFVTASHGGTLSAGVVTWPAFPLAAPGLITRTVTVGMPATIGAGVEAITNTASVSDDGLNGADLNAQNNEGQEVDTVEATPLLALSKSDGRLEVMPGEVLTYTLTIKNVGDQDAGEIVLSDTVPAHTSFVGASDDGTVLDGVVVWPAFALEAGGSLERLVTFQVDRPLASEVEAITNTAVAVGPEGVSDSFEDVDMVVRAPGLVVTKSDGKGSASPDELLTYTIAVENVGTQAATGVVVTDTLPQNTVFVDASEGFTPGSPDGEVAWPAFDLGADQVATRTVTVRVEETLPSGVDAITNTVVVVGDGGLFASDRDVDDLLAAPDLKVSKTDGRTEVRAGEMLTYTLTVENVGTQGATGVVLSDTLPANTTFDGASHGGSASAGIVSWPSFSLAAGASETRTVRVWVADPWPNVDETLLTNRASVADDGANGDDPVAGNNEDTDTTRVRLHQVYLPLVSRQSTGVREARTRRLAADHRR